MFFSKSKYCGLWQCPKIAWLKKYKPSVLTPPDEQSQAIFDTGNIVGDFIGAIVCIVGVICGIAMWLKINEDL